MDHVARYQRLSELGIDVNWDTILFGVLLKCVTSDEVRAFAQDFLSSSARADEHPEIAQLAFASDLNLEEVRSLLDRLVSPMAPYEHVFGGGVALDKCMEPWRREGRKWRLLMLHECLTARPLDAKVLSRRKGLLLALGRRLGRGTRDSAILDCVETVWATFLYPNDMRQLIGHVAPNDPFKLRSPYRGSVGSLVRGVREFFAKEWADLRSRQ